MSDTLIFGTCYIGDDDRLWLVRQWINLVTSLNPDADVMVLHTPGPIPFPMHPRVQMRLFANNPGHLDDLSLRGKDGWGRAFCMGLKEATVLDYRHVAHIETDLLFMHPVLPVCRSLTTLAAAPQAHPHDIPETALMFFKEPSYGWACDFVTAYAWESMQPSRTLPTPELPEQRVARILGDQLTMLPGLLGRRSEGSLAPETIGRLDWLTHANRPTYEAFLRVHGREAV